MNHTIRTLLSVLALPAALQGGCQNHPDAVPEYEVTILNPSAGGSDSARINVYDIFLENAPKAYHIPGAPRFAIKGNDDKFYLGIGGTAKTTVSYDWGDPIDNAYNIISPRRPSPCRHARATADCCSSRQPQAVCS